jgi:hypothetical protein
VLGGLLSALGASLYHLSRVGVCNTLSSILIQNVQDVILKKAFVSRKSAARFARCKAQCAPLCPSLVPSQVTARRCFSSYGRGIKENPPNLPSITTISFGGSFSPVAEDSCLDVRL